MNFERIPTHSSEEEHDVEKEPGFDAHFYVTDHSADRADTGSPKQLRELYEDIKKDGVESVRYDWRWRNIESEPDTLNTESLERYGKAAEVMKEVGLEAPTIILSNPPEWAVKLYATDKEKFFDAFGEYARSVAETLEKSDAKRVERVQILNELNNKVYTPIEMEDLPRLCEVTRAAFKNYNPDTKLMATFVAGNLPNATARFGTGTKIEEYLEKFEAIKDNFDVFAIDYYPGMWHLPFKESEWKMNDMFKQMGMLKTVFEKVASWGKEYELGEVGIQTNVPWKGEEGNDKRQRFFYDSFFRGFKQLMLDFREREIPLPSRIGLYEAMDEAPQSFMGKMLRKFTPFPEHDMGMRKATGERKSILQGKPHAEEEVRKKQPSQLSRIISYVRAPMKKAEK